jgi:D-arabinose 1-dehydrogenase-like Zn-dependent alcohol dehydrogenase
MLAAVLEEVGKMVLRQVPDPTISPNEVLLRVKACGI